MTARDPIRVAAEHEAAHGIVSAALGVTVARLVIYSNGSGECHRATCAHRTAAVISAAGDLWDSEFSVYPYRDSSCRDLQRQLQFVGVEGIWAARRDARKILTDRRQAVLKLGARLYRERELVFG